MHLGAISCGCPLQIKIFMVFNPDTCRGNPLWLPFANKEIEENVPMLASELQEIIQQGENGAVDFQEYGVRVESMAKEIVAFANSQGGVILLGVNDMGEVTGIPTEVAIEEWVMNIVRDRIVPALEVKCHQYNDNNKNKTIAQIIVPKGKDKPYQTSGKFYIRVGSTNRLASQSELMRLFQAAGIFHYDANGVEKTGIQDLNFTALDQYFGTYQIDFSKESEIDKERLLINTDILNENKTATIGGLLIFGINPERYLPQSGISFAHFAGDEIQSELIDKQNISGPLPLQVDRCLGTVKNNLLMPSDIRDAKREDLRLYPPMKVFRELIVNACIHRNYAISGSKNRIFMFTDRIEFISPGRLPNTVTIEKLKVGVSYASNPILVKFMENLRYIDHLGRGLPMVYQAIRELGKEVLFKEVGEEFRVIVPLK
jgi:ATP-dependent DNA helicase RecG